jgi:hypothetical protein
MFYAGYGLAVLKGGLGLGTRRYYVLREDRAGRRPHDRCAGRAMVVLALGVWAVARQTLMRPALDAMMSSAGQPL